MGTVKNPERVLVECNEKCMRCKVEMGDIFDYNMCNRCHTGRMAHEAHMQCSDAEQRLGALDTNGLKRQLLNY